MGQPRDIVIACCRDEDDIISLFIDFYLDAGFDRVCLVDNGSRDSTLDCIVRHPRRDQVSLLTDTRVGYDKRLLDYYNAFDSFVDRWVFFVDVDEWILIQDGIKAFAETVDPDITILNLPVFEMLPDREAIAKGHPLLTTRRARSPYDIGKVVWRKGSVRKIYCGKHRIEMEPHRALSEHALIVRHYHTRSEKQLRRKLMNRIETEMSFGDDERKALSVFGPGVWQDFMATSRRLLEQDGWDVSLDAARHTAADYDDAIRNWYMGRATCARDLSISGTVDVPLDGALWRCVCVQEQRPAEGHTGNEHLVLVYSRDNPGWTWGDKILRDAPGAVVRIHSECLFGDVFGAERCDCAAQLESAMRRIRDHGCGAVLYLRQEGRGVGLLNKMNSLLVPHPDSFVRNERIRLPADSRDYLLAAEILRLLGARSVRLLTGNPAKLRAVRGAGIACTSEACRTEQVSSEAVQELRSKVQRGYLYQVPREKME